MPKESKISPRRIAAQEKAVKALNFRKAGLGLGEIASKLGYSSMSGASQAISRALKKCIREPSEELISLELERLDSMLLGIAKGAFGGHLGSIDRALRIMERRSKLLGLDSPVKVQDVERNELIREIERELEKLATKKPGSNAPNDTAQE